jgi:hypothetical protein
MPAAPRTFNATYRNGQLENASEERILLDEDTLAGR